VQALGDPVDEHIGDRNLAEVPADEGLVLLPETLGHLAHGGATQQAGAGGVSERRLISRVLAPRGSSRISSGHP